MRRFGRIKQKGEGGAKGQGQNTPISDRSASVMVNDGETDVQEDDDSDGKHEPSSTSRTSLSALASRILPIAEEDYPPFSARKKAKFSNSNLRIASG